MLTKNREIRIGLVMAAAVGIGLSGISSPILAARAYAKSATLSSGTVIPVQLNDPLSSNNSLKGDKFTCTIKNDGSDFYNQLPSGTIIEGYVRAARPREGRDAGVLDLAFNRVRYPDGRAYPITAALIGLDSKSVTRTDSGRIIAKPGHRTDRLTYVGYGAGAGLIVGLLTNRTVEDTALGAGLGYLFGALEKGKNNPKDVYLKAGTEMGVRLDRSLSVASYQDSNNQGYRNIPRAREEAYQVQQNTPPDSNFNQNRADNSNGIGVLVGDTNVVFNPNVPPVRSNDTVLVPVRPVLETANTPFKVNWPSQSLIVRHHGNRIKVIAGSRIAVLNNGAERVRMEAPVTKLNGTFYVPLRFLSLATGLNTSWDEASQTVLLSHDR